ncbi:MAG: ornithine carbamoyltransferase [Nitrospina sp.]|nr:ornithine carbamoyltransferase [Nitrospina sp.]MBT5258843.1 ornithine carbamoyltransferase [Nitrospina sp.]MBT5968276.1 ornithine carbamoyltransferase [Nitrospina sp.]MBT7521890.1 ornithine carbamoyltransferase [Nitrospina sp.]MDG1844506.1 ornithine carbamoyltransferase [Nitrospinaceae bacterium]
MNKDFLKLSDLNKDEVLGLIKETTELKQLKTKGTAHRPLEGKTLGMIFNKNSTRTRISFEVGMFELGGHSLFLTPDQMQLGRGETIADSARVLSRYLDGILIRTFDFKEVEELAKHSSIPVINGLTDLNHPIQVLSDLFTIHEKLGHLDEIKIAYVGDGNNVAYSWITAAAMFDLRLSVACPASCKPELPKEISIPDSIEITEDPFFAVKDADVIYTDVWISMGQEDADEKVSLLKPYQINQSLVDAAKKDTLVMHCLPAHREMEITTKVLEGKNSIVFDQAENRLHLQKALLKTLLS